MLMINGWFLIRIDLSWFSFVSWQFRRTFFLAKQQPFFVAVIVYKHCGTFDNWSGESHLSSEII